MAIGWWAYFRIASGFGLAFFPPPLGGGELGQDPVPDVEVARDCGTRRVAHGKLRYLDEPGLDGVNQTKVGDHPRKGPVSFLPDSA